MPVRSLLDIVFSQISVRQALRADPAQKEVLTRICLAKIPDNENSTTMAMFNRSLQAVQGHVCILINYSVWHGGNLGQRKFRKKTLCRCKCKRLGILCECYCACLFKMIMEYREAEVFRGYRPNQRKHKKSPRFISKNTTLGRLIEGPFQDTLPSFTSL